MPRKDTIFAIIHLSRYQDYLFTVITITILGLLLSPIAITQSTVQPFLLVLVANLLSTCFSYMINDIEDAPDDALNPDKALRNPVSAGRVSRRKAGIVSIGIAIMSAILYWYVGVIPFIFGIVTIMLGALYSWKFVRLKNIPILDIISHSLMLGGLHFLCSYFTFTSFNGLQFEWVLPLLFILSVSCYGELFNEMRDFYYDKKAGLHHTAVLVGPKITRMLMMFFLTIAILLVVVAMLIQLIPMLFILSVLLLLSIFSLPILLSEQPLLYSLKSSSFQNAIVKAGTLSAVVWLFYRTLLF